MLKKRQPGNQSPVVVLFFKTESMTSRQSSFGILLRLKLPFFPCVPVLDPLGAGS
jgi:hypothetical protein